MCDRVSYMLHQVGISRNLRVNLLGPGPRLIKKKRIYRAAVSQRLRTTVLDDLCQLLF